MPLKYQIEKESDVPADHKAIYHEKEVEMQNGEKRKMWVLDVDDVVPRARFVEFRDTNIALKKKVSEIETKLDGIDDPDRARALLKVAKDVELDDAEKFLKKGGVDAMISERTKAMKEDMEKKLAAEKARADAAIAELDKTVIENHVLQVCSKLPLQQGSEVLILRMAQEVWSRQQGQIVALDRNQNPMPSKDGTGNLGVAEWLQETLLKQHPFLVKESSGAGASGSGSGGTGGNINVNPWDRKKGTWNLTQQMQIQKTDPQRAERLKAAAA